MTDWKQLELFEREAQTLETLQHPGIPKYIDYLSEDTEKDRGFFLVQASTWFSKCSVKTDMLMWDCRAFLCLRESPNRPACNLVGLWDTGTQT